MRMRGRKIERKATCKLLHFIYVGGTSHCDDFFELVWVRFDVSPCHNEPHKLFCMDPKRTFSRVYVYIILLDRLQNILQIFCMIVPLDSFNYHIIYIDIQVPLYLVGKYSINETLVGGVDLLEVKGHDIVVVPII